MSKSKRPRPSGRALLVAALATLALCLVCLLGLALGWWPQQGNLALLVTQLGVLTLVGVMLGLSAHRAAHSGH